ncbi:MAG: DUF885 domain-containing protein [Pseudomonadota bacterium]
MQIRRNLCIAVAVMLAACQNDSPAPEQTTEVQESVADHSAKANAFFDRVFDENVARSPMMQSYLGMKGDYDQWDEVSEARSAEELELTRAYLAEARETINPELLDAQTKVSFELFVADMEREIEAYEWRLHNYPINQMNGVHSQIPSFLINIHRIADVSDAEAYIARLKGVPKLIDQTLEQVALRAEQGILPPKFTFPYVIESAQNVMRGKPFEADSDTDSTLLADFRSKVEALSISDEQKLDLIDRAEGALVESVAPAYQDLIAAVSRFETEATTDDGAWKLPDGEAFYNFALQGTTTTDLTASEIHEIGLKEVERIHAEMRDIMAQVEFEGSLQEFFVFLREDEQFFYPDTDAGRERYLTEATAFIDDMREQLDALFLRKPKAEIIVKRVEPFRERSAGKAFYQQPTPDGSRPGTYYANLYSMADMPVYQMQALAYHEGIPGHHMQIAIAQELDGLPKFRRFGRYTAYIEGWGLYSEILPKDINAYTDPYQDFGRLAMEIWRAARLVVDTGIHAKQWTREEAIQYLIDNTPNPEGDAIKAIERYILWPSQATAYKVGMLKIQELRARAETELGDRFDIREFHDVILRNGPVPLDVLETFVDRYIAQARS